MTDSKYEKKVYKILGNCNCILALPDGFPYDSGNPLTDLAFATASRLNSFAILNCKYKKEITDLSDIRQIKKNKRVTREFLIPLQKFKEEISGNNQTPLLIILQTVATDNSNNMLFIGSGQGERNNPERPNRSTFPASSINKLRIALEDNGITNSLSAVESNLCGREEYDLNQLFTQKNFAEDLYDPKVNSLLLTFNLGTLPTDNTAIEATGNGLADALTQFSEQMPLVRQVRLSSIHTENQADKKYIFRVTHEADNPISMTSEAYIDELAQSIKRSGLLHPLVLLRKEDGNYKILCGYRRFQALTKLKVDWVEAKIYHENDFSKEDFFDISLAENTKRKNLNPIEIGNFLESAAKELGLNNARLAERFGQTLGIGKPNQNVSQSTVHKYRKVNAIREADESREIIDDIINEKLQFTMVAEILAPIKSAAGRNSFYIDIIKSLTPSRPQVIQIKKLLEASYESLQTATTDPKIKNGIEKALISENKATSFINFLKKQKARPGRKKNNKFLQQAEALKAELTDTTNKKTDIKISPARGSKKQEITIQLKIRPDNLENVLKNFSQLASSKKTLNDLLEETK